MGCTNCSNTTDGKPAGCGSNGNCASGSCGKLAVFDWLSDMELPGGQKAFEAVEVRFKNNRKAFYRNAENLQLQSGDVVVTEASPGHDVGVVSASGELARLQINRKDPGYKLHELRKIQRKAEENDISKWIEARSLEGETMFKARELAEKYKLVMKISDVEYQGDKSKAIFYYTAEERVDFRELIKAMADKFKVRIEMKQIGARQESGRLGGIGSCGRELCCSTWLSDFRSVTTSAARYQQLSLNPQKLAGQCGKLKCCLNYELDQYIEAIKDFPNATVTIETEAGIAMHIKTDIFKRQMWYMYKHDDAGTLYPLSPERVKEIIELNSRNKKPAELTSFDKKVSVKKEPDYSNVVGQDKLERFDKAFKKKKKKKKKRPGGTGNNPHKQRPENTKNHPKNQAKS